jgi:hypothetical protein
MHMSRELGLFAIWYSGVLAAVVDMVVVDTVGMAVGDIVEGIFVGDIVEGNVVRGIVVEDIVGIEAENLVVE